MTKKYLLIDSENCDYVIKIKDTKKGRLFKLYAGTTPYWFTPNELLGTLLDDGNGVKIKLTTKDKLKTVDYAEAEYIRMLLYFCNEDSTKPVKYKIYEKSKIK